MNELNIDSNEKLLPEIKDYINYRKNTEKFLVCISNTICKIFPKEYFPSGKPKLKQIWKIFKKILTEYNDFIKNNNILKEIADFMAVNQNFDEILPKLINFVKDFEIVEGIIEKVKIVLNIENNTNLIEIDKILAFHIENPNN